MTRRVSTRCRLFIFAIDATSCKSTGLVTVKAVMRASPNSTTTAFGLVITFHQGSCVGELNHRKFWLMLVAMTVEFGWSTCYVASYYQVWSGLDYNKDGYEAENKIEGKLYSKEYGAFFMSAVITISATLMVVDHCVTRSVCSASTPTFWSRTLLRGSS
jgi:hypothetical protein